MAIFSYEQLDELGEGLIRQYLGTKAETVFCVDIEGFVMASSPISLQFTIKSDMKNLRV